jgi:hypothetical protein
MSKAPSSAAVGGWTPQPWAARTFEFSFPVEWHAEVVERLRGVPARVTAKVNALGEERCRAKPDSGWSVIENVGHLLDLDVLTERRIGNFMDGAPVMEAADMSNVGTQAARYHEQPVTETLNRFVFMRLSLVESLGTLTLADYERESLHPRLKMPMRLVDLLAFISHHDDYHLARMTHLMRLLGCAPC